MENSLELSCWFYGVRKLENLSGKLENSRSTEESNYNNSTHMSSNFENQHRVIPKSGHRSRYNPVRSGLTPDSPVKGNALITSAIRDNKWTSPFMHFCFFTRSSLTPTLNLPPFSGHFLYQLIWLPIAILSATALQKICWTLWMMELLEFQHIWLLTKLIK